MTDPSHAPPSTSRPSLIYLTVRSLSRLIFRTIYRCKTIDKGLVPHTGPLLVAANHQSYIDPPLVGGMSDREMHFVARSGLFSFGPFGWLIRQLNSVPLKEESGDLGAIKEIVRRLEMGNAVVIFPEGSRCPDGAMHEFKRGVALLVKRAKCPVVPAAVEGCFDAWPRGGLPRIFGKRIAVKYGRPIPYEELMQHGADAALERLANEIDRMRLELRAMLRKDTNDRFPPRGPGDGPRIKDSESASSPDAGGSPTAT
jgi:1-acyl-sn-glycerol-3-phosphate acyltransferase